MDEEGVRRVLPRNVRTVYCLRQLVMALAHDARESGKEALADELEAIEESLQRDISALGGRKRK